VTTVLVVEDERAIADLLGIILADEGYRVVVARNGREGLARVAERRPDVILSDIMMPVLNGLMMGRTLHDDPAYRTIPLVFMSAVPLPPSALASHYVAFLAKPFSLDDVLDTIARVPLGSRDVPERPSAYRHTRAPQNPVVEAVRNLLGSIEVDVGLLGRHRYVNNMSSHANPTEPAI